MTSANEVGARLVLSGGPAFNAQMKEASANTTEFGEATAKASTRARDASGRFVSMGSKVEQTGVRSETASARMKKFGDTAVTTGEKVGGAGKTISKFFLLPTVAIGAVSVDAATKFNASMTRIRTQAGASAHDVKVLSAGVLGLAKTSQQGPDQLAESLFHLKSVGLSNTQAMLALKKASDLAAVSGSSVEDTTNALAGAWRTGIKGAKTYGQAVSTANAIVGAGNMRVSQLNAALGTGVLPAAKTFGLSFKDVGSALALFTDEGQSSSAAATRLRMSFSLLGSPVPKAVKDLKSIGIAHFQLAKDMRGPKGLIGAIGDLKSHLQDPQYHLSLTRQAGLLSDAFGGGRSSAAIMSLLNNYNVLQKKQKQITKSTGDFNGAVKAQYNTPQAQFDRLKSNLERTAILLGDQLLPYALKLVAGVEKLVTWFSHLSDGTKGLIFKILLGIGAFGAILTVVGKVISMVGMAAKVMSLFANPVGLVVIGLALVAVGFYLLYKRSATFRAAVAQVVAVLKSLGEDILNKLIIPAYKALSPLIQSVIVWVQKHQAGLEQLGRVLLTIVVFAIKAFVWNIKIGITVLAFIIKWTWKANVEIIKAIAGIVGFVVKHWPLMLAILTGGISTAITWVIHHWDQFGGWFQTAISKVGGFFSGLGSAILSPFKWAFNEIAMAWNDTVGKLSFHIPSWVPKVGGDGFSVPKIPLIGGGGGDGTSPSYSGYGGAGSGVNHAGFNAMGTNNWRGGWSWVGERGPELLNLPAGSKILDNRKSMRVNQEADQAVNRPVKVQPYAAPVPATAPSGTGDGGTKTFILQTVMDKKVVAEAVYEVTRDKVARL